MANFFIGDLLTGRRLQPLQVVAGSWSDVLNAAGTISCTVTLRDPDLKKLGLFNSATPGKSFLAVSEGDTVLQAGPIWLHEWNPDSGLLTISGAGMWSYFDHRALLPVLAGRVPSDPTTDTRFMPVDAARPWPTDTRTSLQGIARALVAQAQTHTGGNVPVILPTEIPGASERDYRGSDVAFVGERLKDLTNVIGGPDIRFTPRFTPDMLGVEWVMQIGTPTQPLLFSPQRAKFFVGLSESSVSGLSLSVDGSEVGSQAFAIGGRSEDVALTSVSTDSTLLDAGFPLLDLVDSSRSTVGIIDTLQAYSDELALRGRSTTQTMSFSHKANQRPFLSSYNVGDFVTVDVREDDYIPDDEYALRLVSRSGDQTGDDVALKFAPEVF
jgi:hypothetical protein